MKKVFLSLAVVALLTACGAEGADKDGANLNDSTTAVVDTTVNEEAPAAEAPVADSTVVAVVANDSTSVKEEVIENDVEAESAE
mgnify:FL=1|jgi:hypothetical protein